MKIKILEDFKDGRKDYIKDDELTVSDEDGAYFCGNGWAKDAAGQVETGERNVHAKRLDVRNAQHDNSASEV